MMKYATHLQSLRLVQTLSLIALLALSAVSAQAAKQDAGSAVSVGRSPRPEVETLPSGWHPFLGLGAGYTPYESGASVEGLPTSFKFLGSYYLNRESGLASTVFDVGGGLANQKFSQNAIGGRVATSAVLEAAARYQWANRWQAGLVLNDFLNQGGAYHASQGDAQFAGLQALKEFGIGNQWLARAGGRAMTETNHNGPAVYMFLAELQIGWNPSGSAATTAEARPEVPPLNSRGPGEVGRVRSGSILSSLIYAQRSPNGEKLTTFDLASADIDNSDRAYLRRLAAVLKENSSLYGKVVIHGYADISGTEDFNRRVSLARAEAVRDELAKDSGLSRSRFEPVGNGTVGSKGILRADRRIELEFDGVKNPAELKKALSTVQ